jgi:hypothetical protein
MLRRTITIQPRYGTDHGDVYCDGSSDQTEVNAAITTLSSVAGGGEVVLAPGTFKVDGPIVMKAGVTLRGVGPATIVEKNGNVSTFTITGSAGSEITDCAIRDLTLTRNAADTNIIATIDADYADRLTISGIVFVDPWGRGVDAANCDGLTVENLRFVGFRARCVYCDSCDAIVRNIRCDGLSATAGNGTNSKIGVSVEGASGIYLISDVIVKNVDNDRTTASNCGIYASATSKCQITNCTMDTILGASSEYMYGIYLTHVDDSVVSGCRVSHLGGYGNGKLGRGGVVVNHGNRNRITGCYCYDFPGNAYGVDGTFSVADLNQVIANSATDCGERTVYGNCEVIAYAPQLEGATTGGVALTNCTVARSSTQKYSLSYSRLMTKTAAAGTEATYTLSDSESTTDFWGLDAGGQYKFNARVYVPSGAISAAEITLEIRYYDGGVWTTVSQAAAATYDAWQLVSVTGTIPATATGATLRVRMASTAELNELIYIDEVHCQVLGSSDLQDAFTGYSDTNTKVETNSWQ